MKILKMKYIFIYKYSVINIDTLKNKLDWKIPFGGFTIKMKCFSCFSMNIYVILLGTCIPREFD